VRLVIYPITAFRAMSAAVLEVYETIRRQGTQGSVVDKMQTRDELYGFWGYHGYEKKLDRLFTTGDS
jgi:methylisocitrate lyase